VTWSAQLPIYDLPELRERNAALWHAVADLARAEGIAGVPEQLGAPGEHVLFTQICGYPLQTTERGRYALIGTPVYVVDGGSGARHCAFVVVRRDAPYAQPLDLRGTTFAVNDRHSNTGMNLPRRLFARIANGRPFFDDVIVTGSHAASAAHVAGGRVAAASVDCVTYAFLAEFRPELTEQLRIIARTDWSPAIPFVTIDDADHGRIAALRRALARLASERRYAPVLRALHIEGIRSLEERDYAMLRTYEQDAAAARYPVLC
jgi:ABC-type phosphate/phosphonate transport system substrate-binding protein